MSAIKYISRIVLSAVLLAGLFVPAGDAVALSGSEFQPGRIIDDAVFYDKNSMTVQQIQDFLNARVTSCDVNGDKPYYGTWNGVTYNGNVLRKNLDPLFPPPYTCLRDYRENPTTHANNVYDPNYKMFSQSYYQTQGISNTNRPNTVIAGAISAAQIIYNEAQNYSINPKVLLVLIEKESLGLLTDDWPWPNQYKTPTGYACPDTAPCDASYFGFYNQIHSAARQFRLYANNPNSYNYTIGQNAILYNPNASCGMMSVNIVNQATASLYNYTPYVPNQAALNNLYGTGDSCSAYGNRNFWRMFNDRFGSTFAPSPTPTVAGTSTPSPTPSGPCGGDSLVYRFWSPKYNNVHFFTIDENEKNWLVRSKSAEWRAEGTAFCASKTAKDGYVPVYRFWAPKFNNVHHFTVSESEKNWLINAKAADWKFEGIAFFVKTSATSAEYLPIYRFWSPRFSNDHFFTGSSSERTALSRDKNWVSEGVAWYAQMPK